MNYYDPAEQGAATAFVGAGCEDWAGRLDAAEDPASTAYYTMHDIAQSRHLPNDVMSSIAIPYGYSVALY